MPPRPISRDAFDAVLLDLDGVLTRTAVLHRTAWRDAFDAFLRRRSDQIGEAFRAFEDQDYFLHVDGRPRLAGAERFLASRGIRLPRGEAGDPPGAPTLHGVGNAKNARFLALLEERGVETHPDALRFVRAVRASGLGTAVVSASRNCRSVLRAAGIEDLFDARVDGVERERLGLRGKPVPDSFLEAARRLGAPPERCVVVEDAVAGVQAGRAGGFGLVVGVARGISPGDLEAAGADRVVADLGEIEIAPGGEA